MPKTRHVLSQRCHLSVLAARKPPSVMSREIISVYAFRSPLKGVVEYPVVNVAAAANGSEQQSLITLGNELVQVRVDVIANMRRNRHHAGVLVALGAVDTAPLRFSSTTFVGRIGISAMRDRTCHREHTAITVEVFPPQFGHLTEAQAAPRS